MASFSYSPISAERAEVRLLVVEPGSWEDPLECRLQHAVLSEKPSYEALSYTWGDANDKRPITLNGSSWQVTANLESALRSLRQQDKPRATWIDALCINQEDLEEKAEQVPKMWDIYTSATSVVAWLGPAGDDGDAAMEAIQDIATKIEAIDDLDPSIGPDDLLRVGVDVDRIDWSSIWAFLNRPYWRRIWVIQELTSCTIRGAATEDEDKGSIMCGSKSMPKAEFERLIILLTVLTRSNLFIDSGNGIILEPARSAAKWGLPPALRMFMTYSGDYDLTTSLWLAPYFQASVPHDMLYALLGLVSKDESALITPDYSKPVGPVYFDVYKSLILHSKSLTCVLFNRICHSGQGPSWILEVAPRLSAGPLWANEDTFEAASNVPMDICFRDHSRQIFAKGIKIGVLKVVVGPNSQIQQPQMPHQSEEQPDELLSVADLPSGVSFRKFMDDLKAFRETLSSGDDREGLWRTLVMDHDMSDLDNPITPAPRYFEDELEVATGYKDIPADYEPDLPPDMKRPHYLQFSKFLYNVLDSTQNRCFFCTACGKMGLGPYDSKEGDVVAALFGAERLFVLRPISTGYQVVGDAYVQGGMFGEFVSAYLNGDDSAVEEFILC